MWSIVCNGWKRLTGSPTTISPGAQGDEDFQKHAEPKEDAQHAGLQKYAHQLSDDVAEFQKYLDNAMRCWRRVQGKLQEAAYQIARGQDEVAVILRNFRAATESCMKECFGMSEDL